MIESLLLLSALFVAFTNGANANCKGVASLYGSGTTTLRTALLWGTATTFLGSVCAVLLSGGMLKAFSGQGVVDSELLKTPHFMSAVASGAALTSFLATRLGFPVSTTHALVGAIIGAGYIGSRDGVQLGSLWDKFLLPLLFSPAIAVLLGAIAYWILRLCKLAPDHRTKTLDFLHFLSTGAASFARGLNDTPKMAALLSIIPWIGPRWAIFAIAAFIAIGGLLDSSNVAETLGKRVTGMNPGQGFASSLVTAGLVTTASMHSLPASTTHVSVGSLIGMGATTRQAKWRKITEIMFAWISTVPCGAALAAIAYLIIRTIFP